MALSASAEVHNGETPYGPLMFCINRIFNSLRDAHVDPGGAIPAGVQGVNSGAFNFVLGDIDVYLQVRSPQPSQDFGCFICMTFLYM